MLGASEGGEEGHRGGGGGRQSKPSGPVQKALV